MNRRYEYVIWGKPPNSKDETVLYTKAENMIEAKNIETILKTQYGCVDTRIQVLDLYEKPDFTKSINH